MDYTVWSEQNLQRLALHRRSKIISVWVTAPSDLPLIVLVHGISGDHVGLIPLAAELAKTHRVALVDLPGHDKSSKISLPNASALQAWFEDTLTLIENELGNVAAICAHSFGCSAVLSQTVLEKRRVILLNPVPSPSLMYAHYARMIMDSAHFWAHIYNWRVFILLRGITLAKLRTRGAMRRVRWTGWNSQASYKQIIFQAKLVDIILDSSAYQYAKSGNVALVVCGVWDTTARQRDSLDMQEVFGSSSIVFLRGGHLLPLESPDRVANLIVEGVVHLK